MTLRWRIFIAIATVSLLTVGLSAYLHYQELSAEYDAQLDARGNAISESLRIELDQTHQALGTLMARLVSPRGILIRDFPETHPARRYRWATQHLQGQFIDVLKVLDHQGQILTSAHWPASFGALDPQSTRYRSPGPVPHLPFALIHEATPQGSRPALQVWTQATTRSGHPVHLVIGRFISQPVLQGMLARSGGDLVALCNKSDSPCLSATSAKLPPLPLDALSPLQERPDLHLQSFSLGEDTLHEIQVAIGLSRAHLENLEKDLVQQALTTGVLALLLALLLGLYLAHRISSPLAHLVEATGELATGDFRTRVNLPANSVSEITHLVKGFNTMASELEHSRKRLIHAERVATWQEIARGLAHEIKNPLTPILGALRVVQRAHQQAHPDFDAILHEQAGAVHEEVSRLKAMADNFAQFARLPEPRPSELNLEQLLSQIVTLYRNTYPSLEFTLRGFEDTRLLHADSDRLRTVFSNLILNAAQAMQGEGELLIHLHPDAEDQLIRLTLHDSGPGIADEIKDRLFLPYATTKGSSGTGLGLALTHRIITEMGGSIEVDDAADRGACFHLTLPDATPVVEQAINPHFH